MEDAKETIDRYDPPGIETAGDRQVRAAPLALEADCPLCAGAMRLWAGFYRCPNCGYKESCCF